MPPVPTSSNPMGGKLSITLNSVTIPSFMLGEITPSIAPLLRTSERLSGTTTRPTNQLDNPSVDVVFYPNKWEDLQYFMPDNMDGTTFVVGGGSCALPEPVPVTLHYECEEDEAQDVSFTANVSFEDNNARTATDDLGVTIHFYIDGAVNYGPAPTS